MPKKSFQKKCGKMGMVAVIFSCLLAIGIITLFALHFAYKRTWDLEYSDLAENYQLLEIKRLSMEEKNVNESLEIRSELEHARAGNSKQNEKLSVLEENIMELEKNLRRMSSTSCISVSPLDIKRTNTTGGVYDIYPGGVQSAVEVYCDQKTDGGGWIVFQRRMNGSVSFKRNFIDYELGFGQRDGEFWLGLRYLHLFTINGAELRVDMADWDGNTAYAKYSQFMVGNAFSQYTLLVEGYSGTAGESLIYHSGQKFYTKDRDNERGCSKDFKGGMWYNTCHQVNLNGQYRTQGNYCCSDGVEWYHWKRRHGYSLKFVEMKMRPV